MIIQEKMIDEIISKVHEEEMYSTKLSDQFSADFEDFIVYLEKEVFTVLKEHEAELMIFLQQVIYEAFLNSGKREPISYELHDFFDLEENAWEIYENNIKKPFKDRITPIFERYKEEDAFAFVEDLLVDPEDSEEGDEGISNEGRDIIWNVTVAFILLLVKKSS